jgi:hypothetical protein
MGSADFIGFSRGSGQTGTLAEQLWVAHEHIKDERCKKAALIDRCMKYTRTKLLNVIREPKH